MIIELRRAGFVNKGGELMLYAAVEKLRSRYPSAKITMAPFFGGHESTFEKMSELGLYPKAWLWRYGLDWGVFAKLIPGKMLELYGLILDRDVDVVIDLAGFAYGDQWDVGCCREFARSSKKWKRSGVKIIMLPQALGPFSSSEIVNYTRRWVENTDLIFARECDSYSFLVELVGEQSKIKLYPDFTNLVAGTLSQGYDPSDKRVALVPNFRMVEKTNRRESTAYLPFMIRCCKLLLEHGAKPFLLIHEGADDQILAEKISHAVGGIPIVSETNVQNIKGILGSCDATIGSRFHGLVSALSQSVPSLAAGWSHKYTRLFDDYDFPEGVVSVLDSDHTLRKKINMLLDPQVAASLRKSLAERSAELKRKSEEMWSLVFEEIELRVDPK